LIDSNDGREKWNGQTQVRIDYQAFGKDQAWDGLKGYVKNGKMARNPS